MNKMLKVVLICGVIVSLGLSFRSLVSKGTFSCSAESVDQAPVKDALPEAATPKAPQNPAPAEPAPAAPVPESVPSKYDFSDLTSWNLTVSAWEHLAAKDFEGVYAYAGKCLELYEAKAKEMAATMRRFATAGHEDEFALVNDVATARYVMGEALMKQEKYADALKQFETVISDYPYAQCWDPKGWFWKVAEVSKKNIEKIAKLKEGK